MEQKTTNFKKWGWWAVAGLVTILVIAGLIIAITTSGPKPTNEATNNDETSNQETPDPEPSESNNKEEEKPTPELPTISQTPEVDLPKTGPETTILPIISAGIIGYIIALGAITLRRRN